MNGKNVHILHFLLMLTCFISLCITPRISRVGLEIKIGTKCQVTDTIYLVGGCLL